MTNVTRANQLQRLRAAVVEDDDYREGNVHQAILNVTLGSCIQRELGYGEALRWTAETYGDLALLAVLLGKANYYVLNDGFGLYADVYGHTWHRILLRLFGRSPLRETPLGCRYFHILSLLDRRRKSFDELDALYSERSGDWGSTMNEFFGNALNAVPDLADATKDVDDSSQCSLFWDVMVGTHIVRPRHTGTG